MATPPVEPNEELYRQVAPGVGTPVYFDPERNPPLYSQVFAPSSSDIDGLSLVRARLRSEEWAAYRPERDDVRYFLIILDQIMIECAAEAGFSEFPLLPSPDALDDQFGEPWAHCIAAAINRTAYNSDTEARKRIKGWAKKLEHAIGLERIVGPFAKPTDPDTYRPS